MLTAVTDRLFNLIAPFLRLQIFLGFSQTKSEGPKVAEHVEIIPVDVQVPTGYQTVHEDQTTMTDSACFAPGSDKKGMDNWNTAAPSFRILARQENYPLSHQLHVPPMRPAAATFDFSQAGVMHSPSRRSPISGGPSL